MITKLYIMFEEKHGGLRNLVKTSPELPLILAKIVKQRIDEGCWYDDSDKLPDLTNPQELAAFIIKRMDGEYEGFKIGHFEEY